MTWTDASGTATATWLDLSRSAATFGTAYWPVRYWPLTYLWWPLFYFGVPQAAPVWTDIGNGATTWTPI